MLSTPAPRRGRGEHGDALPALEAARPRHPDDEGLLADLLRSGRRSAAPAPRSALRAPPRRAARPPRGEPRRALRRVHRDLLALDRRCGPASTTAATTLLGRDDDVARLRALLAASRVVSILGPGGLGKTRLAHVIARGRAARRARRRARRRHLAGRRREVGSCSRVRDSVASRRGADAGAARRHPRARSPRRSAPRARRCSSSTTASTSWTRWRPSSRSSSRRPPTAGPDDDARAAGDRYQARAPARRARRGASARHLFRQRAVAAPAGRPARRRRGRRGRRPARRPAAGDRARRRPRPGDVRRGRRAPARRPLRAPARRGLPPRTGTARSRPSSAGRGTCSTTTAARRCGTCPCSTTASRSTPQTSCSGPTRSPSRRTSSRSRC